MAISGDLRAKIEQGKREGELSLRFEGHQRGEPVPRVWMEVEAKRIDGVWDFRIRLGSGAKWRRDVPEKEYELCVESLHAAFSQLGTEIPRA